MDLRAARELTDSQSGVVARRQLVALGATPADLRRWLRRRELVAAQPGVYVHHTGPLTWVNRAWVAVLGAWPAALCHTTAIDLAGHPLHVAVARGRTPRPRPGVRLHWLEDLEDRVAWHLGPPRLRVEDAVLGVAAGCPTRVGALVVVSDACRRRRTTPARLAAELARRPTLRHRALLLGVLAEVGQGVHSALESAYLCRVERPHGLPRGRRQAREATGLGVVYHDVEYDEQGVLVELDGRLGHELSRDRWDDLDRDLWAASTGRVTLRVGWRQAEEEPCRTAALLGEVLRGRGWRGGVRRCGRPGCPGMLPIAATR